jgi:hypothetical protein
MKETKELVVALVVVGKLVVDRVKDGVDLSDAVAVGTALVADPAVRAAVEAAIKDVDKVDDELKAAGVAEYLGLAAEVLPKLAELLKKA